MWLCNAFSLQMLPEFPATVTFEEVGELPAEGLESAVGHADTAAVLGVEVRRVHVTLKAGETFFVAQLVGGRLPEGSTELPEGCTFKFLKGVVR
jgi:hypothetical protein